MEFGTDIANYSAKRGLKNSFKFPFSSTKIEINGKGFNGSGWWEVQICSNAGPLNL